MMKKRERFNSNTALPTASLAIGSKFQIATKIGSYTSKDGTSRAYLLSYIE
jgi:hypothetical protein